MNNLLSGSRILVVEDELIVSWLLEQMLATFGCIVIGPAARIGEALDILRATVAIDAAVLDINLNGQKSYPVADALVTRAVPFMFSTGYRRDSMLGDYQKCPVLQKPYSPEQLSEALIQLLKFREPNTA